MIRYLMFAGAALAVAASGAAETETSPIPPEVSAVEAYALIEERDVVLIDVRRPEEWAETGVAKGAHRITLQDPDFLEQVVAIVGEDADADVAFICRSGGRSATARDQLMAAGYSSVTSVAGGTLMENGWIESGLPIEETKTD